MARIDDYKMALEIATKELSNRNPLHFCRIGGAQFIEKEGQLEAETIKAQYKLQYSLEKEIWIGAGPYCGKQESGGIWGMIERNQKTE